MVKIFINSFLCGWLMCLALLSLWQDWIGLESYLKFAREHWANPRITVPLAVLLLIAMLGSFVALWSTAEDADRKLKGR